MQTIRVTNAHSIRHRKPVLLMTASRGDRYQVAGQWHALDTWQHGQQVEAVNHFNRHTFSQGELLEVKSIEGTVLAHVEVTRISMADPAQFTAEDFGTMGYASRAAYMADWGEVLGERVWVYRIQYLSEVSDDRPN